MTYGLLTSFCTGVMLQLAEVRAERSSLAERLQNAEKTSELQQQELQRQLHSVEQNMQLRERDLMHVHQQYQMLYQQFLLLQQQSASFTVRFCRAYIHVYPRPSYIIRGSSHKYVTKWHNSVNFQNIKIPKYRFCTQFNWAYILKFL